MFPPPRIAFKPHGRTGNNIFQYMMCKLLALLYGNYHQYVAFQTLSDEDKNAAYWVHEDNALEHILSASLRNQCQNRDIICDGYFQKSEFFVQYREPLMSIMGDERNEDYWINEHGKRDNIRDLMHSQHKIADLTENDIVISLRLDDFIQLPDPVSDIIPPTYYTDIIEKWGRSFYRLFIVCDRIRHSWEQKYLEFFSKWDPILLQ